MIVQKSDRVSSRLSATSTILDCCGQSMCDAVLISLGPSARKFNVNFEAGLESCSTKAMKTNPYRVAAVVALLGFAGAAFPQGLPSERNAAGESTRPDGTRPADGAIKGGSILPGENAGVPSDKSD